MSDKLRRLHERHEETMGAGFTAHQHMVSRHALQRYTLDHSADFIALIEAARAVYKIAERDTDEFNALRDALKQFDE